MSLIINYKSNDNLNNVEPSKKKRKRKFSENNEDNRLNSYKSHCGLLRFRPKFLRKLATIQMFVFASCVLVTLQQALSSGYFNSVITTIEKRFDVPSRLTGSMVSIFEIGNLITITFVSYFGTNRHIPVWIGKGVLITGVGSLLFAIPHFMNDDHTPQLLDTMNTTNVDSLCHLPEPISGSLMERASYLLSPELDPRFCGKGSYRAPQLIVFMIAMILIGGGATPIFTLGTIFIDDHTPREDSSMYIGCIYSMVAFGLMVGYLLGGYFITMHENSFGSGVLPYVNGHPIYNGHPKFIGNWWAGFVLLGTLLILISFVFFTFPRSLKKDKKRKRMVEMQNTVDQCITITTEQFPQQSNHQIQLNKEQINKLLCNCKSIKCNECANNDASIKFIPNHQQQLNSFLNNCPSKTTATVNSNTTKLVPLNNNSLATSTTTKLQLSIAPSTNKRHHRHHSASAMMNCTSSFLLGDQKNPTPQPVVCNATSKIRLGHHRSISTSTIHHHLYHLNHLHNSANVTNNNSNQTQIPLDKLPFVIKQESKENELKMDCYKQVNSNKNEDEDTTDSYSLVSSSSCASERKLKDIPSCMWSLISNPVYIITCLGSCMELCIVSGFLVFLPKYLETQFGVSKSEANLYSGGVAVPGACIGIFLGGYLLKKLQLKPKNAIQFVLFFNLICMGLYTALYFLGCDNPRIAGATISYKKPSSSYFNSTHLDAFQVNLNSECNRGCRCSPNEIEPICGINGITYFSPCHAGCSSQQISGLRNQQQSYSNCTCIQAHWSGENNEKISLSDSTAKNGPCKQNCENMIPFLILLFVVTLVVSITQMPLLMVILRSVNEDERAFALGMQFVLFRLFGYIPSPILFGEVIDSSCLLWKANCGVKGGFCLLYNIEQFRVRYVGVCSALKVAAGLLFFLDLFLICYRNRIDQQQPVRLTIDEVVNSIYTLDQQITNAINCDEKTEEDISSNTELHALNVNANHDSDYNSDNNETENDELPI